MGSYDRLLLCVHSALQMIGNNIQGVTGFGRLGLQPKLHLITQNILMTLINP